MAVWAVIPARLAATRLPNKPLADLAGVPMVVRVWQQVCRARLVERAIIATEDPAIGQAAEAFGVPWVLTGPCSNGTERVLKVALPPEVEVLVNVQGDEPLIDPSQIDAVVESSFRWDVTTACAPLADPSDPSRVKVVITPTGRALYFSRQPIPTGGPWKLHLGLYAFRREVLPRIAALPPSDLERSERLEQLRWLEAGLSIGVVEVPAAEGGVDTPEDLERVRARLRGPGGSTNPA